MLSATNVCNQLKRSCEYRKKNIIDFDMCFKVEKEGKYIISNRIKIHENITTGHVSLDVNCLIINRSHIYPAKFGKRNCHDLLILEKYQQYQKKWYSKGGAEITKKYQLENKEHIAIRRKKYYDENNDQIKTKRRKRYEENTESIKSKNNKWYDDNKEKINAKRNSKYEQNKEYREHRKLQSKMWYQRNKDIVKKRYSEKKEQNRLESGEVI